MRSLVLVLVLLVVIGLPVAWVVSEFKAKVGLRCALGVLAILSSFGVAFLAAQLNRFNYNAWYGCHTKSLIDTSVEQLEQGRGDAVLAEWRRLRRRYQPTYENRAHYDELVEERVRRTKEAGSRPRR